MTGAMSEASGMPPPAAASALLWRRSFGAGLLSVAELGSSQVLRLVSNLVMTRLLLPEAFGLMAMVTTLHVALALFTDIGVHTNVVRSPRGAEPLFLRVAWTVQATRGAVIAGVVAVAGGVLWLLAPVLAAPGTVYADPALPGLVAVSALVPLIGGFGSTAEYLAGRRLQFGRIALLNIGTQLATLLVMIALAWLSRTVWALLAGMLTGAALRMALTHLVFAAPRMRFAWDAATVDELWQFGKWLIGSSAFNFVAANADRLILAALLDARLFGFYVIALMWVQGATQITGMLAGRIGFAALSEVVRDRPAEVARVFRRISTLIDGLCVAAFVAFILGGAALMRLLYTPDYATAAAFLPLLAVGILANRFATLGSLLLARGDSKAMLMNAALAAVAVCVALPVGYHGLASAGLGLEAALLAVALGPVAGAVALLVRAAPLLGRGIRIDIAWVGVILAIAAAVVLTAPAP